MLPKDIENLILSFVYTHKCSKCKDYFDKEGVTFYYNNNPVCYPCLEKLWCRTQ